MTTIAYKDGILAADSRLTTGSTIVASHYNKVRKLDDGRIVAAVGNVAKHDDYIKQLASGEIHNNKLDDDGTDAIIVLYEDRLEAHYNDGIIIYGLNEFYAFGSGSTAALAAMHMGLTAIESVKFASKLDVYTNDVVLAMRFGGKVVSVSTEEEKYEQQNNNVQSDVDSKRIDAEEGH